ncbi:lipoxygenase family protein [Marinomonas sp. THO17]|uniref:lipoxygenase family protein n=1 Tax=Marinomonas sp. THO17 TaxID=3149048 RepID=UPI00336BCD69
MKQVLALPQVDVQNSQSRKDYLQKMQKLYAFTLTYDGQIATINSLPDREKTTFYYKLKSILNLAGLLPSLPSFLINRIKFKYLKRPFTRFDDYFFYSKSPFPNPEMRENFLDNKYLGYQRVAGMNPVVLEGVNKENPLPECFKVKPKHLGMTQQAFDDVFEDGRFYMTNYAMLEPLFENPGYVDNVRKYIMPAIALYSLNQDGTLKIEAIQLDATKDTDEEFNPIITPEDDRWNMARTYIQAADGTHQELWTHATRIHYVLESVIMVSWRQLAENHPLLALLRPHLKFTLSVNVNPLFQKEPDGTLPSFGKMFGCDNDTLVAFMGEGMNHYSFKEFLLPNDLARRHVNDPRLLYPYRDDGILLWDETLRYVTEYLDAWYENDQMVADDFELQNWAQELGGDKKQNNCGLTDFPTSFADKESLIKIVAHIIFIATAHHSSVHYPQYECAGYAPNLPFSAYQPPLTPADDYQSEQGLVSFFPPYDQALEQSFIFYLTNFKVNRMGQFDDSFIDSKIRPIIRKHQSNLEKIHQEIEARNATRIYPYKYMDPKNIPNSVTV